jgi:hypothetical protein
MKCCLTSHGYKGRAWLNDHGFGGDAYITIQLPGEDRELWDDDCTVSIADCSDHITLEFPMSSGETLWHTKRKLAKVIDAFNTVLAYVEKHGQEIADKHEAHRTQRRAERQIDAAQEAKAAEAMNAP